MELLFGDFEYLQRESRFARFQMTQASFARQI